VSPSLPLLSLSLDPVGYCYDRTPLPVLLYATAKPHNSTMSATRNYTWLHHVVFVLPPSYTYADTALNGIYFDDLHRLDDLFAFNRDDIVPDLLTIVQTQVVETLIAPLAIQTRDPLLIPPCIQPAVFHVTWVTGPPRGKRVRDAATLKTALDDAHAAGNCTVKLLIGLHHLHFDARAEPLFYLDWSYISTIPFPSPNAPHRQTTCPSAPDAFGLTGPILSPFALQIVHFVFKSWTPLLPPLLKRHLFWNLNLVWGWDDLSPFLHGYFILLAFQPTSAHHLLIAQEQCMVD
jgi:hypothetical protein